MSGESEYYNPIIQAMVAANQSRQHTLDRKQQAQEFSDRQKLAQQHEDFAQKHSTAELEHQKGMLDIQKALAEAGLQQQHLQNLKSIREQLASGVMPEAFQQKAQDIPAAGGFGSAQIPGTPSDQVSVPGYGNVPISALPNAQQEAARMQSQAMMQAAGRGAGEEPFKQAEHGRTMEQEAQKLKGQLDIHQSDKALQLLMNQRTNETHLKAAQITANAHIQGLQMGQEFDPQLINNTVNDLYLTGNTKLSQVPQKLRLAIGSSVPNGWTPLNEKDTRVLTEVGKIEKIMGLANELSNYSINKNLGSTILGATGFGPADALKRELTAVGGTLAETFGKEVGRKSEGDIKRAVEGLYSPRATQQQNQQNIAKSLEIFKSTLAPIIGKYAPDQVEGIFSKLGIDGSKYIQAGPKQKALKKFKFNPDTGGLE